MITSRAIHGAVAIVTHQEKIERLEQEIKVKEDQIRVLKWEMEAGK